MATVTVTVTPEQCGGRNTGYTDRTTDTADTAVAAAEVDDDTVRMAVAAGGTSIAVRTAPPHRRGARRCTLPTRAHSAGLATPGLTGLPHSSAQARPVGLPKKRLFNISAVKQSNNSGTVGGNFSGLPSLLPLLQFRTPETIHIQWGRTRPPHLHTPLNVGLRLPYLSTFQ